MARCQYCKGLSINKLVELAQEEFLGHELPEQAYYQHHPSFHELEISANLGCDICQLILESFKGTPTQNEFPGHWPWEWLGSECNEENSMYAIAKSLPDSTVRICINCSNVYGNDTIEKISVFDTILVHLGPKKPLPDIDDPAYEFCYEEEWECPMLTLGLETPRDQPFTIHGFNIGRYQLDLDLGSATNFSIARQWLTNCKDHHVICGSKALPLLPTRVIDVGMQDDFEDVKLLHTHGLRAEYAALSHCWGGSISPLLTFQTLNPFQDSVSFAMLPANFRDAITIVRKLGLRYVWIDSLCIIQNYEVLDLGRGFTTERHTPHLIEALTDFHKDSLEDWHRESKKMGHVYRDATLTISAMASNGSTKGILKCSSAVVSPPSSTLPVFSDDLEATTVTLKRYDWMEEGLGLLHCQGPLSNRGWTLQESTLSRRNLLYGANQIYWSCGTGYHGANGLTTGQQFPQNTYDSLRSLLTLRAARNDGHSELPSVAGMLDDFYALVSDYSGRQLTVESDKLLAFSGLAHFLQPVIGGEYLAGIWSCDIARGLKWRAVDWQAIHVSKYRAPSWSWAVTNEAITHIRGDRESEDVEPYAIELLAHDIVLVDRSNPFGQVKSGSITLRGLALPLYRSSQVIHAHPCTFDLGSVQWDDPADVPISDSWNVFRIVDEKEEDEPRLVALVNKSGRETGWGIDTRYYHAEPYLVLVLERTNCDDCLVLRRVDAEEGDVYERVGMVMLMRTVPDMMKRCKMHTVTLI